MMTKNRTIVLRRSVAMAALIAGTLGAASCASDGLVPADSPVDTVGTPATDTRTVDPPTMSNLPVTTEP